MTLALTILLAFGVLCAFAGLGSLMPRRRAKRAEIAREARRRTLAKQAEWLKARTFKDGRSYAFKVDGGGMEMGRVDTDPEIL